jgi:CSLREA domain-containing protein
VGDIARRSVRSAAVLALLGAVLALPLTIAPTATAAPARTFTVNSSGDDANASSSATTCQTAAGTCTLRAALQAADASGAPSTINFAIPGSGRQAIITLSPLPAVSVPLTLDGYSQPGSSPATASTPAQISVAIEGPRFNTASLLTAFPGDGLTLLPAAAGSRISGVQIFDFLGNGIDDQASGSQISGDLIGYMQSSLPLANVRDGVELDGASHVLVGGPSPADANVIDHNGGFGSVGSGPRGGVLDSGGSDNTVMGNIIGTDLAGDAGLGNWTGITLSGTHGDAILHNVVADSEGFTGDGVDLIGGDHATVAGNLVGTDPSGEHPLGNGDIGIAVTDSPYALIGGAGAAARNVVSANHLYGIEISGASDHARVVGNYVGTDAAGTEQDSGGAYGSYTLSHTFGNRLQGIIVSGAPDAQIGAPGEPNVLDNNAFLEIYDPTNDYGQIAILGPGASGAVVQANLLGVRPDGSSVGRPPVGRSDGIVVDGSPAPIIGGPQPGDGNVVANMQFQGIFLNNLTGGSVQDNLLGTSADGTTAAPDNVAGTGQLDLENVSGILIGGVRPRPGQRQSCATGASCTQAQLLLGAGNLSSAASDNGYPDGSYGISLQGGSGDTIEGNLVGTDVTGERPLGNGTCALVVTASNQLTIGGPAPGEGNVIAANGLHGIQLATSTATTIQGNRIGTDAAGTRTMPNLGAGVDVLPGNTGTLIGGPLAGDGNLISGNGGNGEGNVLVSGGQGSPTTGTIIQGNLIGTSLDGSPLSNPAGGVRVLGGADGTIIGGAADGEGNTIAGHTAPGVTVDTAQHVTIRRNSVFANQSGIVLLNGANAGQAAPELSLVRPETAAGTLAGTPGQTYTVDFYVNRSGGDEGARWLGSQNVTVGPDGLGQVSRTGFAAPAGTLTATATDPSGDTSAFSTPVAIAH